MSKVVGHRLTANLPADTDLAGVRFFIDNANDPDFIGKASVGQWPLAQTRLVAVSPGDTQVHADFGAGDLADGTYDFAGAAVDTTGNQGDAVTSPEWTNVPLDLTAPGVLTNLTISVI